MSTLAWATGASTSIGAAMRLATSNVVAMRFTVDSPDRAGMA
jgi:hypothetical protein